MKTTMENEETTMKRAVVWQKMPVKEKARFRYFDWNVHESIMAL